MYKEHRSYPLESYTETSTFRRVAVGSSFVLKTKFEQIPLVKLESMKLIQGKEKVKYNCCDFSGLLWKLPKNREVQVLPTMVG